MICEPQNIKKFHTFIKKWVISERIYPTFALNRKLAHYEVKNEIFRNRSFKYIRIYPSAIDCPSWVSNSLDSLLLVIADTIIFH